MKRIVLDQPLAVQQFVARKFGVPVNHNSVALGLVDDTEWKLIAGVLFDNYNGASICMHVAAVEGARWMTRDYLQACFGYPFNQLGVKKIVGFVGSSNHAARKFDEHLGFRLEATLEDAHPDGDLLVYTMTPEDCRWHRIHHRKASHGIKAIGTAPA